MRLCLGLFMLILAAMPLHAAETVVILEQQPIPQHSVVYYTDWAVDSEGSAYEQQRSVVLSNVEVVRWGEAAFLRGTMTTNVQQQFEGSVVHLRMDKVFLVVSSDSNRAARELQNARTEALWETVTE